MSLVAEFYNNKIVAFDKARAHQADVYDNKWNGLFKCRRYWKEGNNG